MKRIDWFCQHFLAPLRCPHRTSPCSLVRQCHLNLHTFKTTTIIVSDQEGVFHTKNKMCSLSGHPRRRFTVSASVSQQWMLCSEWVPSEWESDKNKTIIHQLTSGEDKSWNKSIIKSFYLKSIIMFPPLKKCISCCLSHIKIQTHISLERFWSVQISLLIQTRTLLHWRKCYYGLWTHIWVKTS